MSFLGIGAAAGAAGDLFGGAMGFVGDEAAAKAYKEAAGFATESAAVAKRSGVIQEAQANRQIYQAVSGQTAAEGASGLSAGGSSQYLQRASLQQGGLQKAIIQNNATIQVQGYEAEAAADQGQAAQATAAGAASLGGGIFGSVGMGAMAAVLI